MLASFQIKYRLFTRLGCVGVFCEYQNTLKAGGNVVKKQNRRRAVVKSRNLSDSSGLHKIEACPQKDGPQFPKRKVNSAATVGSDALSAPIGIEHPVIVIIPPPPPRPPTYHSVVVRSFEANTIPSLKNFPKQAGLTTCPSEEPMQVTTNNERSIT